MLPSLNKVILTCLTFIKHQICPLDNENSVQMGSFNNPNYVIFHKNNVNGLGHQHTLNIKEEISCENDFDEKEMAIHFSNYQ